MTKTSTPAPNAILCAWEDTRQARGAEWALFNAAGTPLRRFREVEEESRALEATLPELPVGSVVGLQLGNSPHWPALLLALFRRGCIPLPLGRHMAEAELEQALTTCGATLLMVTSEAGELTFTPRTALAQPPSCEFLKLTSGTTNAPRGVRFQSTQLLADCDQICRTMGITAADLNYGVIPVSHSYGFSNLLLPLLCRGVPLALAEDRMPRAILEGLAATGATVFPGMPVFYDKLAQLEDAPPVPRLRLCISAGAPLTRAVGLAFTQRFGLKIHTFYGSSECGGIAYDASETLEYEEGFVGRAMAGVSLQVSAPAGEAGRLEIRSAAVGDGYFPEDGDAALAGGCFTPGDLVQETERGFFLTGRATDVINIAGRKLNPAEVEHHLLSFPGVRQAVVFGVPSPIRGEEPIACVVGAELSREALQRFCLERLSRWQMPRDFWLLPELPANERGKTSRRLLAEQYLARP